MKRHIYRAAYLAMTAVCLGCLVTSCDLTRKPTASLNVDEAIETFDDAVAWNRGVYAQFRNRQGGSFVTVQERMGDCLNASAGYGNRGGMQFGWKEMSASDGDVEYVYQMYYSTLKNTNKLIESGYQTVIDNIETEKVGKDAETVDYLDEEIEVVKEYLGNAYFVRAYYYFNLLYRFGIPYNSATASTDLGVPVVTTYNVSERVQRGTVKEGYDLIFSDLEQAEKLLANVPNEPESFVFDTDAITALKARIYLEQKDYEKAYAEATKLINSGRYPLVEPTPEAFMDMWRYDTSSEFILLMPLRKGTETANGMGSYYSAYKDQTYHTPDWIPAQGFIDKFADNDLRRVPYFEKADVYYNNIIFSNITIISKFRGNPALATQENDYYGPIPNGQQLPKIFRIAEDYLIAAEAAYFSGKDALKPLNALRVSRGLEPLAGVSGDALLQEIKDERLRELAFEGFRTFDLRRWGDPMHRMASQVAEDGSKLFLTSTEAQTLKIPAGDPKFIFPIPQYDINVYGEENMPQNPGW